MAYCDISFIIKKHLKDIDRLRNAIIRAKGDEAFDRTIDFYNFIKSIADEFYDKNILYDQAYAYILNELSNCEMTLPNAYILNNPPHDFNKKIIRPNQDYSPEVVLNYLVSTTRNYLYNRLSKKNRSVPYEEYDLMGNCKLASSYIKKQAKTLKLEAKTVIIYSAYKKLPSEVFGGDGVHYISIIEIDGKMYLIDCTYSQFFLLKKCLIDRLGIMGLSGCRAGLYMSMTEERRKIAEKILKDGWIELTPEVLKHYLDGFTISYRNGIYYEDTEDFSFTAPYSVEDYENFLRGFDNQLNYEDINHIGYQMRPLKDPNMKFSKP